MKRFSIILLMILSLVLVSCSDKPKVDPNTLFKEVVEELSDIYLGEDSADSVTSDLNLRQTTTKLDGVIIAWESSDSKVVSNTGIVNRQEEDVEINLKLVLQKDSSQLSKTFVITVIKELIVEYEIVQYTETFDDVVLGSTYSSPTYIGVNETSWEIIHARASATYSIDGNGIMLSGANGDEGNYSSLSTTFSSGLIDFSFDYMKAFTGTAVRNYVVRITNDGKTEEITLPSFGSGSGAQLDIYKFTYDGPELKGEVKVEIAGAGVRTNKQATFDNFTWRQYSEIPADQVRHQVTFDTQGGDFIEPINVVEGRVITFIPTPTKTGFDFVEWQIDGSSFNSSTLITKEITLVATWIVSRNTVTLDLGHIETSNITYHEVLFGHAFNKPHQPDREGYNFVGWYEFFRGDDNHDQYNFSTILTKDIRLIAKWEKVASNPVYIRDDEQLIDYYEPVKGKTGEQLVLSLRNVLTDSHTEVDYGSARYSLEEIDQHPFDNSMVLGIYDRAAYVGPWNHPNWEREHVWPNSKLGVERAGNDTFNQASDLHNLRAILPVVNGRRSNRYFVNPVSPLHSPVGHIVGDGTYYPGDEDIGDVARIFLYMAVRYDVLKLTDDVNLLRLGDIDKTNNTEVSAYMGTLSLLYDWHLKDPVDEFEIRRNDLIDNYQGNRNPFIDHPELFEDVYSYFMDIDIARANTKVSFVIDNEYVVHIDYTFFKEQRKTYLVA